MSIVAYYYYDPNQDRYFTSQWLYEKEWGYELLTKQQYLFCTGNK